MATLTILIFTFLFVGIIQAVNKYTPTWITSNYIKSDCADVISNKTGNASQPSATIPFPGSAFTQVPNIGYGAFNYHGNNMLIKGMMVWLLKCSKSTGPVLQHLRFLCSFR